MKKSTFILFWVIFLAPGCASKRAGNSVLEEVRAEVEAESATTSVEKTELSELSKVLEELGYQGVGMEYESSDTLVNLKELFQDPRLKNRNIQLVYTGLEMAYDNRYQSLTIKADESKDTIIKFVEQQVPAAKKPSQ